MKSQDTSASNIKNVDNKYITEITRYADGKIKSKIVKRNGIISNINGPAITKYYPTGELYTHEWLVNGKFKNINDNPLIVKYHKNGNRKYIYLSGYCGIIQHWYNETGKVTGSASVKCPGGCTHECKLAEYIKQMSNSNKSPSISPLNHKSLSNNYCMGVLRGIKNTLERKLTDTGLGDSFVSSAELKNILDDIQFEKYDEKKHTILKPVHKSSINKYDEITEVCNLFDSPVIEFSSQCEVGKISDGKMLYEFIIDYGITSVTKILQTPDGLLMTYQNSQFLIPAGVGGKNGNSFYKAAVIKNWLIRYNTLRAFYTENIINFIEQFIIGIIINKSPDHRKRYYITYDKYYELEKSGITLASHYYDIPETPWKLNLLKCVLTESEFII